MSELVSIVYRPTAAPPEMDGYVRIPLEQANLVAGHGIEGDAKGGSANRQLNIMSAEAVTQLAGEGFCAAPGQLGEQLILAGVEVDTLPPGTQLRIGSEACVEFTEPRTGCAKFERHQARRREEAAGRMGMMARVLVGGAIAVGDPVTILKGREDAG